MLTGGAIVDDDDLNIPARLLKHGLQCPAEKSRAVAGRHDDCEERHQIPLTQEAIFGCDSARFALGDLAFRVSRLNFRRDLNRSGSALPEVKIPQSAGRQCSPAPVEKPAFLNGAARTQKH